MSAEAAMQESQPPASTGASILVDERLLPRRFLVVSNRLPYEITTGAEGLCLRRGVGGLITALDPVMRFTGGTWIGWPASDTPVPDRVSLNEEVENAKPYCLRPIHLDREEVERYYLGHSNRCLWPLFHCFQEHCEINHDNWHAYRAVNTRFAEAIVREYQSGDLIWIHDYHLMLVPAMVRRQIPDAKIGFFLHIPFPSDEIYPLDPHAQELADGLLGADLVGFHTTAYSRNFMDAVVSLTSHRFVRGEMKVSVDGRPVKVATLPISIDFGYFESLASREEIPARVGEIRDYYRADIVAIGVDRLDYTKGILERMRAIEIMLDLHPELQGKFTFVQISAPSRTKVHAYQAMREKIERMVGHVNGRFGSRGCLPIDYRYENHPQEELVAYYRASDLALVTPLRDGMNLVAKEYVASRLDEGGALVLSRFAGACDELRDAVIVNPYDPETTAEQIHSAITMDAEERRRRMRRMREVVRRNDIYWWLERFLREFP